MTIASLLSSAGTSITSAVSLVWDIATSNPLCAFFVGVAVVGVGFTVFKKVRRSIK